jgi:hypothetical protein
LFERERSKLARRESELFFDGQSKDRKIVRYIYPLGEGRVFE